jgi:hypothetical protein
MSVKKNCTRLKSNTDGGNRYLSNNHLISLLLPDLSGMLEQVIKKMELKLWN